MLRHLLASILLLTFATWSSAAEATNPDAPAAAASAATDIVTDPAKANVTVTPTGSKYHTKDCKNAKAGKEETLKQALADGMEPCAICHPAVYDPSKIVVYEGGDSGKKYHAKGCKFAKGETTLAKAKAEGLEPCKVCNPPPLPETVKPSKATDDAKKK